MLNIINKTVQGVMVAAIALHVLAVVAIGIRTFL